MLTLPQRNRALEAKKKRAAEAGASASVKKTQKTKGGANGGMSKAAGKENSANPRGKTLGFYFVLLSNDDDDCQDKCEHGLPLRATIVNLACIAYFPPLHV